MGWDMKAIIVSHLALLRRRCGGVVTAKACRTVLAREYNLQNVSIAEKPAVRVVARKMRRILADLYLSQHNKYTHVETPCALAVHAPSQQYQYLISMSDSGTTRGGGDSVASSVNTIGRHEFEFGVRTMSPPLAELLESSGCGLFLDAMRTAGRLEGANSVTILAPNDNAFVSAGAFEDECWGLHMLDGAYKIGELVNFNGGRVQPQSLEPKHMLVFRVEFGGHMVAYAAGETKPARRTRVIKANLVARNGVFVHIVDKMLYAS